MVVFLNFSIIFVVVVNVFGDRVSLCSPRRPGTHCVAQAGPELMILLSLPPKFGAHVINTGQNFQTRPSYATSWQLKTVVTRSSDTELLCFVFLPRIWC